MKHCTGRDLQFEREAEAAGVGIYYHCTCGTTFCQHDQATLNYYADYSGETKGAWLMWKAMQRVEEP